MLIKSADDRSADLDTLRALLRHPQASETTRASIEQEIRNLASGLQGEREAAYEIDFHYSASKYWAIVHDLRLEHRGRVAQIDHLMINLFLDVWVCESKRFAEGLAVNEHGEFSAFYKGRAYGVPSPFEQNRKHCAVLQAVFDDGAVDLPKRLGFAIRPSLRSLVLVSKNARISRPATCTEEIDSILKVDQIKARIRRDIDAEKNPLLMAKLVSSSTLSDFVTALARLHRPAAWDWHARFGLPRDVPAAPRAVPEPTPPHAGLSGDAAEPPASPKAMDCAACGVPLSQAVVRFCRFNKPRFGGQLYCMNCQKDFPPTAAPKA